jgi:hypothetical protein
MTSLVVSRLSDDFTDGEPLIDSAFSLFLQFSRFKR